MTAVRITNAEVATQRQFLFPGSIVAVSGDLLWYDGDEVRPTVTRNNTLAQTASAALFTDLGTEAKNQQNFARNFAGVAKDSRGILDPLPAGGSVAYFPVATDVEVEMDCVSSTWEEKDLVAACEYTAGALAGIALEPQKLKKTTDVACAIGYCTQREANAVTRVKARLISRVCGHAPSAYLQTLAGCGVAVAETLGADRVLVATDPRHLTLDPGGQARNVDLPVVSTWPGETFIIDNSADGAEVITVRLTGGGTTVVTPTQNEKAIVWNDGTNCYGIVGARN